MFLEIAQKEKLNYFQFDWLSLYFIHFIVSAEKFVIPEFEKL